MLLSPRQMEYYYMDGSTKIPLAMPIKESSYKSQESDKIEQMMAIMRYLLLMIFMNMAIAFFSMTLENPELRRQEMIWDRLVGMMS